MRTNIVDADDRAFRRHYIRGSLTRVAVVRSVAHVVDYLFWILYALLAVRFVLELMRAQRGVGFVEFIRSLSNYFYAPFAGIVPSETVDGVRIVWPLIVAFAAYALLHAVIRALLRLVARA